MIATFAYTIICIIWMGIMVVVLECDKHKKLSLWKKILYSSLMIDVPFVIVLIRIAHPGIFIWMGLILLCMAITSTLSSGMKQ